MPPLNWADVRESLAAAIRDALPLQLKKADGDRIARVGLHMDAYYGSSGLYLLPEAASRNLSPKDLDNLGDWPISTDWNPEEDHALAFSRHWGPWDDWFHDHLDDFPGEEGDNKFRRLLQTACEAIRQVERAGSLDVIPKTDDFKVIVAEHDEPTELGVERYELFLRTGTVRCHGD